MKFVDVSKLEAGFRLRKNGFAQSKSKNKKPTSNYDVMMMSRTLFYETWSKVVINHA